MRKTILSIIYALISIAIISAQATDCPLDFEPALARASELCLGAGRNQVCYGNNLVNMVPQRANLTYTFNMPGDITDVNNVQALSLSALDEASGNWGIALMRLLANLDPTNSQDVTIILFGDVDIDNAVPYQEYQEVVSNAYSNIRRYPKADATVVQSVVPSEGLQAIGKIADNSWIQVVNPATNYMGWISAPLLNDVDFSSLEVVNPYIPYFGPMQAFYYSSGTSRYDCTSIPGDGMLIQTPEGLRRVTLWINEVTIEFLPGSGTTTLVQTELDNSVSFNMLEGSAFIQNGQSGYVVVPGSKVTIHKNSDSDTVNVSSPVPYDSSVISSAPVDSLDRPIEVMPPADESAITSANSDVLESSTTNGSGTSTTEGNGGNGNGNANGVGKPDCPGNSCNTPGQNGNNGNGGGNGNGNGGQKKNDDCPGNSCNAPGHNKNKDK